MGVKINLKDIIVEIEYLLIITFVISCISDDVMNYLDKYYICLLFVIYHELSHILVATFLNKKLRKVFISISGLTAYFKYEYKKKSTTYYIKDIAIFIAGPLSNIIMAYIFKKVQFHWGGGKFVDLFSFFNCGFFNFVTKRNDICF